MTKGTRTTSGRSSTGGVVGVPMTFDSARAWLDSRVNVERLRPARVPPETFKLDRMRAMLGEMGNPERDVRCVHVAGSKGKGSICDMVASMLGACGHAVGVFTSPHLIDVRERIRIGSKPISEDAFAAALEQCARAAQAVEGEHGPATYFELLTAAALAHFARQAVDLAVVEVGLGGRLDSTNVIEPIVCAIGSIQLEHTTILGDTLAKIAREKAGIMKPGVPVISVPQEAEVIEVFREVAAREGASLMVLGDDIDFTWRFEASHDMGPHARVSVTTPRSEFEHLPVPLPGEHQAPNCGLALAVIDALRARGFDTPERDVSRGLAATPRHGRMEEVLATPRIVVDGAHTPDSLAALFKGLGQSGSYDSIVVVFGCAEDKRLTEMLTELERGADKVIFTRSADNPRAADPIELQHRWGDVSQKMAQVAPSVKDAINAAAAAVGRNDLILVTGSFYVAGEAKRLIEAKFPKPDANTPGAGA